MQRPCLLVAIRRVEFVEDGNLQPWRQKKALSPITLPSFENTCLGPVGHQVSAP